MLSVRRPAMLLLAVVITVLLLACGGSSSAAPTRRPTVGTTPTTLPLPFTSAWLAGIECEESSLAYGDLVVPEINLWESTGPNRGRVVDQLPDAAPVQVLRRHYVAAD